jgi:hypothetical protein
MLLQLCPECMRAFFSKVIEEFAIILRSIVQGYVGGFRHIRRKKRRRERRNSVSFFE